MTLNITTKHSVSQTFALPYNTRDIFIHQWQLVCAIGSDPIASSRRTFGSVLTLPCRFIDWTGICLPATFRERSDFKNTFIYVSWNAISSIAFSPTRTVNLCYTRISALHRETDWLALPTVATAATAIVYRLILHKSVYYSAHKNVILPLIL